MEVETADSDENVAKALQVCCHQFRCSSRFPLVTLDLMLTVQDCNSWRYGNALILLISAFSFWLNSTIFYFFVLSVPPGSGKRLAWFGG